MAIWSETHEKNEKENLLYWGKDGKSKVPRIKRYLEKRGGGSPQRLAELVKREARKRSIGRAKGVVITPFCDA